MQDELIQKLELQFQTDKKQTTELESTLKTALESSANSKATSKADIARLTKELEAAKLSQEISAKDLATAKNYSDKLKSQISELEQTVSDITALKDSLIKATKEDASTIAKQNAENSFLKITTVGGTAIGFGIGVGAGIFIYKMFFAK